MKFTSKGKKIDINKAAVSKYNDEQLAEFAKGNGIDAADIPKLKERLGSDKEEEEISGQKPVVNSSPGAGSANLKESGPGKTGKPV